MVRNKHKAALIAVVLAVTGMTLAPVISEAAPQRKGAVAAKARPAPAQRPAGNVRAANNSGNRAVNNSGNRSVRNSANTNINNTHINNNNVNVNRNVNVNVDNDYHGYHDDWDDHWHPVATAAAIGITAAVIGSIVYSVPPSCSTIIVNGISYSQCGSTWYQPQYVGTTVQYIVVNSPH